MQLPQKPAPTPDRASVPAAPTVARWTASCVHSNAFMCCCPKYLLSPAREGQPALSWKEGRCCLWQWPSRHHIMWRNQVLLCDKGFWCLFRRTSSAWPRPTPSRCRCPTPGRPRRSAASERFAHCPRTYHMHAHYHHLPVFLPRYILYRSYSFLARRPCNRGLG